jgi:hypothetical protein
MACVGRVGTNSDGRQMYISGWSPLTPFPPTPPSLAATHTRFELRFCNFWFWQDDCIISLLLPCVIAVVFGAAGVPGEENAPVPAHIVT